MKLTDVIRRPLITMYLARDALSCCVATRAQWYMAFDRR